MPGFIGIPELMLLGLVVLLVFGPKRLPEMGRSMGR
jgi:sec-independent protein translocase protein TatA